MRRGLMLYATLALAWLALLVWQAAEHQWVCETARRGLADRANDISAALSVLVRSQGRVAMVPKARLESALSDLVDSTDLLSVTLLSASGEIAASAGQPMAVDQARLLHAREVWEHDRASFANLVALGPGTDGSVLLSVDPPPGGRGPMERPGFGPPGGRMGDEFRPPPPPPDLFDGSGPGPPGGRGPMGRPGLGLRGGRMGEGFRPPPPPDRPPWMDRQEYERLIQERGVHWFLISMPTEALHTVIRKDLQLRGVVSLAALLACLALSLAWRSFHRSADLRVQLVRSQENAVRLEELNLTAAGLVHETKNPLNLIRGLAQMLGRGADLPEALRGTAVKITEEADRITGRLNQFLDYARPPQPHPKLVQLTAMVENIFEVLASDREEKSVIFKVNGPSLDVIADESLLRQVLFNLIHNAIQAVPNGGTVEVRIGQDKAMTARLDVCDNGPGVAPEIREDIFRPYFTASEKGTGLGLAIVRQLASAHGWDVTCVPCDTGAVFRIQGIELAGGGKEEERA